MGLFDFMRRLTGAKQERTSLSAQFGYDLLRNRDCDDRWEEATRNNATMINNRETRQQLRDMARYEERNNPHLKGILNKLVCETLGTGPRLSIEPLKPTERNMRAAERLEETWDEWCDEVDFFNVLRLAMRERIVGGESFMVVYPDTQVSIPICPKVHEADQFQTPYWDMYWQRNQNNDGRVDGIVYDSAGRIIGYDRLDYHPYGNKYRYQETAKTISPEFVFHWFHQTRASLHRGVSEVAPTLEVYSSLRRFIESKVKQEELRAKMLGTIETAFPPEACTEIGDDPAQIQVGDGQFTTLPDGWKATLFKLDVTGEGVAEFTKTCLSWATQALMVPWNLASGDSSDYNFASGRLDHMLFHSYVKVNRSDLTRKGLDWLFWNHWLPFARTMNRVSSDLVNFEIRWYWDNMKPIDEKKSADASVTLKDAKLLDEVAYWRERGHDAAEVAERQIRFELQKQLIQEKLEDEMGVKLNDGQNQPTEETQTDSQERSDDTDDVGSASEMD